MALAHFHVLSVKMPGDSRAFLVKWFGRALPGTGGGIVPIIRSTAPTGQESKRQKAQLLLKNRPIMVFRSDIAFPPLSHGVSGLTALYWYYMIV